MKIVLAAVNAKYIHSNLAIRYLRASIRGEFPNTVNLEFNINQSPSWIVREIIRQEPDVLGLSCYIWNWSIIQDIVGDVRGILPDVTIILGGPEVSYDCAEHLTALPEVDFLIRGEGETPLLKLLRNLASQTDVEEWYESVPGLVCRTRSGMYEDNPHAEDLVALASPYPGEDDDLDHKVLYYEASRGCPYRCSFCLSSLSGAVRHFPLDRVIADLKNLVRLNPEQIRFVDRTFNAHPARALELIQWMSQLTTSTRFHLEITGDGLSEELLKAFEQAPSGRFQLEIGVQSSSPAALQGVRRRSDLDGLAEKVRRLRRGPHPTRIMLDLIAGLPNEDWASMARSFRFVYGLQPMKIHLGFLKFLRGSELRHKADSLGYTYQKQPPYEILTSPWLDWKALDRLHTMEDLVDKYYNSGRFSLSLSHGIPELSEDPFDVFCDWVDWWTEHGMDRREHSAVDLYRHFRTMVKDPSPVFSSALAVDFRRHYRTQALPSEWQMEPASDSVQSWLQSEQPFDLFPELKELSRRQILKRMHSLVLPASLWGEEGELHFAASEPQTLFFYYPDLRTPAEVLVYDRGRNSVTNPRIP